MWAEAVAFLLSVFGFVGISVGLMRVGVTSWVAVPFALLSMFMLLVLSDSAYDRGAVSGVELVIPWVLLAVLGYVAGLLASIHLDKQEEERMEERRDARIECNREIAQVRSEVEELNRQLEESKTERWRLEDQLRDQWDSSLREEGQYRRALMFMSESERSRFEKHVEERELDVGMTHHHRSCADCQRAGMVRVRKRQGSDCLEIPAGYWLCPRCLGVAE